MKDIAIVNLTTEEFVSAGELFAVNGLRDHLLHQRSLFSLLGILTQANGPMTAEAIAKIQSSQLVPFCAASAVVRGRWLGCQVVTVESQDRNGFYFHGRKYANYYWYVVRHFHEISYILLTNPLVREVLSIDDKPTAFRRFVWQYMKPAVKDYSQLDINALERICDEAAAHPDPRFWVALRPWLLRRDLSDEARRYLGGRPGRIAAEQEKKRRTRRHRGVRVRNADEPEEM